MHLVVTRELGGKGYSDSKVHLYWEQARIDTEWNGEVRDYEEQRIFQGAGQGLQWVNAYQTANLITPQGLTHLAPRP
jgi:hypothetical protein